MYEGQKAKDEGRKNKVKKSKKAKTYCFYAQTPPFCKEKCTL